MSELDELLAEERARAERRDRMPRAALVLAGAGLVVALGAGGALAVSATASVAEAGLGGGDEAASGSARAADVVAVKPLPTDGADGAGAAPVGGATGGTEATEGFGNDVGLEGEFDDGSTPSAPGLYDASTDLATIPRPPADWPQSELDNAEVWLTQQGIIADCMLEKGFDYQFVPWWLATSDQLAAPSWGYSAHLDEAAWLEALDGPPDRGLGEDYDWREAGCQGYAVHVTGMDDAN
ncbi:hypothetical protein ACWKWP_05870 [Agromyces soli]